MLHTTEKILEKNLRFRVKFCLLSIIYKCQSFLQNELTAQCDCTKEYNCNRKTYLT